MTIKFLAFFALVLLTQLECYHGLIADKSLSSNIPGGIAIILSFGMARGGTIKVDYQVTYPDAGNMQNTTAVTKQVMEETNTLMQLLVVNENQKYNFYSGINFNFNNSLGDNLCMSPTMFRKELYGVGSISHVLGINDPEADLYSVFLVSCRSSVQGFAVNVTTTTTLTNSLPYSTAVTHLPIDLTNRLNTDVAFLIAYGLLTVGLLGQMLIARRHFTRIHWLFLGALLLQIIHVAVDYSYYRNFDLYGIEKLGWYVTSAFFDHSAETAVLLVFFMLSMGWGVVEVPWRVQPQLWRNLAAILVYWVLGGADCLCLARSDDSPYALACGSVYLVKYIVYELITLAILLYASNTISELRVVYAQSTWIPATPLHYARMVQYESFRICFFIYWVLPSVFGGLQSPLQLSWADGVILQVALEALNVIVLLYVGCMFAPFQEAFVTRAFDGSFISTAGPHAHAD